MERFKTLFAVVAVIVMLSFNQQAGHAQQGIDPAFLAEVQGRWVSRFPSENTEIEINGTEIRVVTPKPDTRDKAGPGTVVGVITSVTKRIDRKSLVDGRTVTEYDFKARTWTTSGQGRWFLTDDSYSASFRIGTTFCRDSDSSPSQPISEYGHLSGLWIGDAVREEVKRATYRPGATHYADVIVPKCTETRQRQQRGNSGASPSRAVTSSAAAASRPPRSITTPPAEPPVSVPVTSAQELAEIATRERLNREQADFAARQLAENAAAKAAYEKALADREAIIAAQNAEAERKQREYQAAKAEADRKQREYEAAMAKWRADVEACERGDKSRCAPQP